VTSNFSLSDLREIKETKYIITHKNKDLYYLQSRNKIICCFILYYTYLI